MNPVSTIGGILACIQVIGALSMQARSHKETAKYLAKRVELLAPLIKAVQDSGLPLSDKQMNAFSQLEHALESAKDILEKLATNSKFYMLWRSLVLEQKFRDICLELDRCLNVLPLIQLQVSDDICRKVQKVGADLRSARVTVSAIEDKMSKEIAAMLKAQRDGNKANRQTLEVMARRLGVNSRAEMEEEMRALQRVRDRTRVDKEAMEEQYVEQMIALISTLEEAESSMTEEGESSKAEDERLKEENKAKARGLSVSPKLEVPSDLACPISKELMADPVLSTSTGQTYERVCLQRWIDDGNKACPATGKPLTSTTLIPNFAIKKLIASWCEDHGVPPPQSPMVSLLQQASGSGSLKDEGSQREDSLRGKVLLQGEGYAVGPQEKGKQASTLEGAFSKLEAGVAGAGGKGKQDSALEGAFSKVAGVAGAGGKRKQGVDLQLFEPRLVLSRDEYFGAGAVLEQQRVERGTAVEEEVPLDSKVDPCPPLYQHSSPQAASNGPASATTISHDLYSPMPGDFDQFGPQPISSDGAARHILGRDLMQGDLYGPPSWGTDRRRKGPAASDGARTNLVRAQSLADTGVLPGHEGRRAGWGGRDEARDEGRPSSSSGKPGQEQLLGRQGSRHEPEAGPGGLVWQERHRPQQVEQRQGPGAHARLPSREGERGLETQSIQGELPALLLRNGPVGQRGQPTSLSEVMPRPPAGVKSAVERARVEKLVAEMMSEDGGLARAAADEVRQLAKDSPINRHVLAQGGAIKALVRLLQSSNMDVRAHAVTALLNLSILEANKSEILNAGALPRLVEVLGTGSIQARENAAATLFSLSVTDPNKDAIGRAGAIPLLLDLLRDGTERGQRDAITALFNLSIYPANKALIVRTGKLPLLVEMARQTLLLDKSVAVLSNLSTIPEGRAAIVAAGGLPLLVHAVTMGSPQVKENAAAALLQLCGHSQRDMSTALSLGVAPALQEVIRTGTERARLKAVKVLEHLQGMPRTK